MKLHAFAFVSFSLLAACGGDGASVSIVGLEPADQAAEIAGAVCDQVVACGEASFEFVGSDPVMCTATIEPADEQECLVETEADILADLQACNLTAEQEQLVQDCINAQLAQPCFTQADLDDYCEQIEAGQEPMQEPLPEPCPEAFALLNECGAPA